MSQPFVKPQSTMLAESRLSRVSGGKTRAGRGAKGCEFAVFTVDNEDFWYFLHMETHLDVHQLPTGTWQASIIHEHEVVWKGYRDSKEDAWAALRSAMADIESRGQER